MASPASTEASEIRRRGRQRLIGAVALVLILVVFVPMILDSEPRPARQEPSLAIPSKENAAALPAPAPASKAPAVAAKPQPPAAEPPKTAALEPPKPAASVPAKPAAPAAPAAPATAPKLEGFAVQVGAFRDEAKLKQAREKLAAAGVVHYTERLEAAGGPLTRLRAGPFPTREAAETALAVLKRAALDGKVVPVQ
jgi:DedD protein